MEEVPNEKYLSVSDQYYSTKHCAVTYNQMGRNITHGKTAEHLLPKESGGYI
jgi:hypothetical protein